MRELLSVMLLLGELLFPTYEVGRRLGTLRLGEGARDARGAAVPAGVYSLRYVRQPPLKDHVDTAAHPDFALLLPVAQERDAWTLDDLLAAGRKASGSHPWVLALVARGTPGAHELGEVAVEIPAGAPAVSGPACARRCAPCPDCGRGARP
jgi:hypothetical protein